MAGGTPPHSLAKLAHSGSHASPRARSSLRYRSAHRSLAQLSALVPAASFSSASSCIIVRLRRRRPLLAIILSCAGASGDRSGDERQTNAERLALGRMMLLVWNAAHVVVEQALSRTVERIILFGERAYCLGPLICLNQAKLAFFLVGRPVGRLARVASGRGPLGPLRA